MYVDCVFLYQYLYYCKIHILYFISIFYINILYLYRLFFLANHTGYVWWPWMCLCPAGSGLALNLYLDSVLCKEPGSISLLLSSPSTQ